MGEPDYMFSYTHSRSIRPLVLGVSLRSRWHSLSFLALLYTHTHILRLSPLPSLPSFLHYTLHFTFPLHQITIPLIPTCFCPIPFLSPEHQTQPSSHTSIHIFRIYDNILIISLYAVVGDVVTINEMWLKYK